MLVHDIVTVSLRQVVRNRSRYQGVMIIISLGIAGLIVLATLGESIELAVGRNLEILGRACLIKAIWRNCNVVERDGLTFHDRDLDSLRRLHLARYVTPFARKPEHPFYCAGRKIHGLLIGVDSDFFDSLDLRLSHGRRISDEDVTRRNPVCVIGKTIWNELFPGAKAVLGRRVRIEGLAMKVVGVIGGIEDRSLARTVMVPISVALTQLSGIAGINGFYVRAGHWDEVERLKAQVARVLHRNQSRFKDYIEVEHFPNKIKTIKKSVFLVNSLLVTALATTLFLGGLAIAGTMRGALQERTRDIGLQKAVGASRTSILLIFLAEAVAVSVTGALVGVVVGVLSVEILKHPLQTSPQYKMLILSIVGGLLFGVVLGVAAGLIPAKQASDLDSAQAMRFE